MFLFLKIWKHVMMKLGYLKQIKTRRENEIVWLEDT